MRTVNSRMTVAGAQTGDLSASFNTDPFSVGLRTSGAVQLVISGSAALNGTVKLQASNDPGNNPMTGMQNVTGVSNWVDVTLPQAITVDGASMIDIASMGYRWLRLVYTRTAGSGTIAITLNAKGPY
jgi:hypothetical protein